MEPAKPSAVELQEVFCAISLHGTRLLARQQRPSPALLSLAAALAAAVAGNVGLPRRARELLLPFAEKAHRGFSGAMMCLYLDSVQAVVLQALTESLDAPAGVVIPIGDLYTQTRRLIEEDARLPALIQAYQAPLNVKIALFVHRLYPYADGFPDSPDCMHVLLLLLLTSLSVAKIVSSLRYRRICRQIKRVLQFSHSPPGSCHRRATGPAPSARARTRAQARARARA